MEWLIANRIHQLDQNPRKIGNTTYYGNMPVMPHGHFYSTQDVKNYARVHNVPYHRLIKGARDAMAEAPSSYPYAGYYNSWPNVVSYSRFWDVPVTRRGPPGLPSAGNQGEMHAYSKLHGSGYINPERHFVTPFRGNPYRMDLYGLPM
jgi:hypothetical protein